MNRSTRGLVLALTLCTLNTAVEVAAQGTCSTYPLEWVPPSNAQALAQADLDGISNPTQTPPTLNWSTPRGTLTSIRDLNYALPACPTGTTVRTALFNFFSTVPNLMPLASPEWSVLPQQQCEQVGTQPQQLLMLRRTMGHGERQDQGGMTVTIVSAGGSVVVTELGGDFLPVATTAIADNMAACPNLELSVAQATVAASQFTYNIFSTTTLCAIVGSGTYSQNPAAPADTVTISGAPFWGWADDNGFVTLHKKQTVHLVLNPLNVTPDLIQSDANCNGVVGFSLTLDAVTGALLASDPGIGCIVC